MAHGGEVFVLDMGQPVKIRDLAARMIRLMGLAVRDEENPGGDIEISFTGLRPAEKLFEELLIGENVSGTDHPRIMRAREDFISSEDLYILLSKLEASIETLDREGVRNVLREAVKEYQPRNGIDDLVWDNSQKIADEAERKVVNLNPPAGPAPRDS